MKRKLKVGILLNSFQVAAWEHLLLEKICNGSDARITALVMLGANNIPIPEYDSTRSFQIYEKLDRRIFKYSPDALSEKDASFLLENIPILHAEPIDKTSHFELHDSDIDQIESMRLDLLIQMSSREFRSPPRKLARFGVWVYHNGDGAQFAGNPPGFWEILKNNPITGSGIRMLNGSSQNGQIIFQSFSRTHRLSLHKSRNITSWKAASFIPRMITQLRHLGDAALKGAREKERDMQSGLWHRYNYEPGLLRTVVFGIRQIWRIFKMIFERKFFVDHWFLMFGFDNGQRPDFPQYKKIMPPRDRFWADPHVIFRDGKYYVYIEEYPFKTEKGIISLIVIDKNGNYSKPIEIMDVDCHLSYPYVFEHDGKTYMIPETGGRRTIELYRSTEFPSGWELESVLMSGFRAVDTTLLFHNKRWWLFCNGAENDGSERNEELYIFYADDFKSTNWTAHPCNPVISDVRSSRPAGGIYTENGKLYRPSQDCSEAYGGSININEIVKLTETEFEEKQVDKYTPDWDNRIIGMHTISKSGGMTVIDAYSRRLKLF